jgi:hypothetical protein
VEEERGQQETANPARGVVAVRRGGSPGARRADARTGARGARGTADREAGAARAGGVAARDRQRREGENERRSRADCLKYVIFGGQGSASENNTLIFGGCVSRRRKQAYFRWLTPVRRK